MLLLRRRARARAPAARGDRRATIRRPPGPGGVAAAAGSGAGAGRRTPKAQGEKAERKIRRLTQALGTVRELDVTVQLLDELAAGRRAAAPRPRGCPGARDRRARRAPRRRCSSGCEQVNTDKLDRRLEAVADRRRGRRLEPSGARRWRPGSAQRVKRLRQRRSQTAGQMYAPEQLHAVRIADQEAALRARAHRRRAASPRRGRSSARSSAPRTRSAGCTTCRCSSSTSPRCRRCRRRAAAPHDGGLEVIAATLEDECRHLHGRYVSGRRRCSKLLDACTATVVPQLARSTPAGAAAAEDGRAPRPRAARSRGAR